MNVHAQYLLILNVFQREIRNKTVLILSLLTILALIGAIYLFTGMVPDLVDTDEFTSEEMLDYFKATESSLKLFLSLFGTWTSFMALFVGSSLIRSDQDSQVLNLFITLPVKRWEYLMARFLGGAMLVMGLYIFGSLVLLGYFATKAGSLIGVGLWISTLFPTFMLIMCFMSMTLVFQLYFPTLFSFVLSLISSILVSQTNQLVIRAGGLRSYVQEMGAWEFVLLLVNVLFPPIGHWGRLSGEVMSGAAEWSQLFMTTLHSLFGIGFIFILASWLFTRKDL